MFEKLVVSYYIVNTTVVRNLVNVGLNLKLSLFVDEQTLLFAKKLAGAWQTADKEMTWFFDEPDQSKYPHWTCQIKYSLRHKTADPL